MGRYLIVLYHQPNKTHKKKDLAAKEKELNDMKKKYGVE